MRKYELSKCDYGKTRTDDIVRRPCQVLMPPTRSVVVYACRACSIDLGGGRPPASLMEAKASEAQGRPS